MRTVSGYSAGSVSSALDFGDTLDFGGTLAEVGSLLDDGMLLEEEALLGALADELGNASAATIATDGPSPRRT